MRCGSLAESLAETVDEQQGRAAAMRYLRIAEDFARNEDAAATTAEEQAQPEWADNLLGDLIA